LKRYIYLISPKRIINKKFYKDLNQVLKTNKVKYFQLRLKKEPVSNLIKIGKKIKKITQKNNVKLLINDSPLVAKMINADGCHIGQSDMSISKSRKILGKNKIIGVTCHNSKKLALAAKKNGADYVAFGSFYKSLTKKNTHKADLKTLLWTKKKINMPTVAIGGINNFNYKKILSTGVSFVAFSGYIWNNRKYNPLMAIKNLI
jgi:thiamine-phosphate pyrophosphorylase